MSTHHFVDIIYIAQKKNNTPSDCLGYHVCSWFDVYCCEHPFFFDYIYIYIYCTPNEQSTFTYTPKSSSHLSSTHTHSPNQNKQIRTKKKEHPKRKTPQLHIHPKTKHTPQKIHIFSPSTALARHSPPRPPRPAAPCRPGWWFFTLSEKYERPSIGMIIPFPTEWKNKKCSKLFFQLY